MNSDRTITRTTKGIGKFVGAIIVGILSTQGAFAQSTDSSTVFIEVGTQQRQTFQGFGAEFSDTLTTLLPRGGRADQAGSTASKLYDLLLSPNKSSLNLSFLRLDLLPYLYQKSAGAPYDFPTAVVKTGQADVIKAVKSRNKKIKLCYVPGTPPFWMKENNANYDLNVNETTVPITNSPDANTTNHLLATQKGNYAALLGQFCTDFKTSFGSPLDALSLQNEPEVNADYNSCLYPSNSSVDPNAATFTDLVTAMRQVAPFSSWSLPQLWGPDYGDAADKNYPEYIAAAADLGLLNALCLHSYGLVASGLPVGDYHRNNLPVHMTEYSLSANDKSNQLNGVASEPLMAAKMANEFCKDANDGQVASWFWFRCLADSSDTGTGLIIPNYVNNPSSVYKYIDAYQTATADHIPLDHGLLFLDDKDSNNNDIYPATGGPYQTRASQSDFSTDWTLTSRYYAFRRLTQSVLSGSANLSTTTLPRYNLDLYHNDTQTYYPFQDDVYSAAFLLPSGKYCIVVANQSSKQYTVNLTVDGLKTSPYTGLTTYYTAAGSNDVSWPDQLTNGVLSTTSYPDSVVCYVQQ